MLRSRVRGERPALAPASTGLLPRCLFGARSCCVSFAHHALPKTRRQSMGSLIACELSPTAGRTRGNCSGVMARIFGRIQPPTELVRHLRRGGRTARTLLSGLDGKVERQRDTPVSGKLIVPGEGTSPNDFQHGEKARQSRLFDTSLQDGDRCLRARWSQGMAYWNCSRPLRPYRRFQCSTLSSG